MLSILAAAAVAAAQPVADDAPTLLTFSASPALRRTATEVTVGVLASRAGRTEYWLRRQVRLDRGRVIETGWTDSRRCPDVRAVLAGLEALPGIRPHVSGLDGNDDLHLVTDGVGYTLDVETAAPFDSNARLTLRTNVHTPLAEWVEGALAKLAPCWSAERPVRG